MILAISLLKRHSFVIVDLLFVKPCCEQISFLMLLYIISYKIISKIFANELIRLIGL